MIDLLGYFAWSYFIIGFLIAVVRLFTDKRDPYYMPIEEPGFILIGYVVLWPLFLFDPL